VPSTIDVAFAGRRRVLPLGRDEVRYDPFRIVALAPPPGDVVRRAARDAADGRLFLVIPPGGSLARKALAALPPGSRRVVVRSYRGINRIEVVVVEPQTASGA